MKRSLYRKSKLIKEYNPQTSNTNAHVQFDIIVSVITYQKIQLSDVLIIRLKTVLSKP